MNAVAQVLKARGIAVALEAVEDRERLGALPGDALLAAALACTDAADFRRRIRERPPAGPRRHDPGTPHGGAVP